MTKSEITSLSFRIYQDSDCVWQILRRCEMEYDAEIIYQDKETARRYAIRAKTYLEQLISELEHD